MNREQRRKELKRARFERSRRINNWDMAVVQERVFGAETAPPPAQPLGLLGQIEGYMRALGIRPVLDLSRPCKEAQLAETLKVEQKP